MASLALAVGTWALGTLTALEPEQLAEEVTTTTSFVNDTPEWQRVETITDRIPYGVIRHKSKILVLTSTPPADAIEPAGLEIWQSADGVTWEAGGTVIRPDGKIDSVGSTALGLFAIGSIGDDETTRAWLSADGINWVILMDGLPVETESSRPSTVARALSNGAALDDVLSAIGADASVIEIEVVSDQGIALVTRPSDPSRPYELESFEIWRTDLS
jgi:hypothetical protein